MSPMADLQREYLTETEEEASIFSRVTLIASKKVLDPRDVIDRGVDPGNPVPRFGLDPGLALRVRVTISDMQSILKRAALMVNGRTSYFRIDPNDALMPILKAASGLEELNAAWLALHRRMQLAQGFFNKYVQHYRTPEENLRASSPVSTNPDVYDRWPSAKAQSVQLTYLFDNVRHHQDQIPAGYDRDTDDILSHLKPPSSLSAAFPDRLPESRPSTVYYSTTGERRERRKPEFSSWQSGPEFELPTEEILSEERVSPETRYLPKEDLGYEKDYELERPEGRESPSTWYYHSSLSARTPFKDPNEFFVPKSPTASRIPGPNLPDPIRGMASAAPYGMSMDSVSQAMKAHRQQFRPDFRDQNRNTDSHASEGVRFSSIPEESEGSSEIRLDLINPEDSAKQAIGHQRPSQIGGKYLLIRKDLESPRIGRTNHLEILENVSQEIPAVLDTVTTMGNVLPSHPIVPEIILGTTVKGVKVETMAMTVARETEVMDLRAEP
ncbi:hypothetical protein B0H13DRAFT_2386225 [Mycena leptocephala]|nr:hypothetical protein B0H13DRAFT_2386225 [Mycena leptocephala]